MGAEDPDAPRQVDVALIYTLGEVLRATREQLSDKGGASHRDALAAYDAWLADYTGANLPVSMALPQRLSSMHDVLPTDWSQELTVGEPLARFPTNRDRALGHAVELAIVGQVEQANVVKEATTFLAFLEGDNDITPPVPVTAATLSDRLPELNALGLYVWGSDCTGECSGNTTPDSLVCDQCGGTRTTPLLGLIEDR